MNFTGSIEFQPTEFGGYLWLLGNRSFAMRATEEMRAQTPQEVLIPCPEQLGPALAEVTKARPMGCSAILRMDVTTPEGPMRAVRLGEVTMAGEHVVPIDMQAVYFHAVRGAHGEVELAGEQRVEPHLRAQGRGCGGDGAAADATGDRGGVMLTVSVVPYPGERASLADEVRAFANRKARGPHVHGCPVCYEAVPCGMDCSAEFRDAEDEAKGIQHGSFCVCVPCLKEAGLPSDLYCSGLPETFAERVEMLRTYAEQGDGERHEEVRAWLTTIAGTTPATDAREAGW